MSNEIAENETDEPQAVGTIASRREVGKGGRGGALARIFAIAGKGAARAAGDITDDDTADDDSLARRDPRFVRR